MHFNPAKVSLMAFAMLLKTLLLHYNTLMEMILLKLLFQIFCPAPDCKVTVPQTIIEKFLGIRKQHQQQQAKTCVNKVKQQQLQQHEEIGISKKCPGKFVFLATGRGSLR